jgi:non-ribosomal peptide synthase protein (TIGR01720 family)
MRWNSERLLLVTVEGHGRSPHFDDIDLSRTLGVMPMEYPILLDFATVDSPQEILDIVNAELKQLAPRGLRYGALRYMNPDTAVVEQLAAVPQPDLFFNYLATSVAPEISDFKVAGPYNGRLFTIDETTLQPLPLLVTGYLANDQLQVSWHYSSNQYRAETMDSLAEQTIEAVREYLRFLQAR